MKHLKKILSIILVLAVFAGSFVGSWHLFNQGTYEFDSEDLAVFDENLSCYYLQKVNKDIIFRVCCSDSSSFGYSLTDDKDNVIHAKNQKAAKIATIFFHRQVVMKKALDILFLCKKAYHLNQKN